MDAYTLELKKLLADHQAPQVMKSLMDTLGEASQSNRTLKAEIEPLQSKIIMLSSRLKRINTDREQNLIDHNNFGIELARFEKSILNILNALEEDYPGLVKYFQEKDEEAAWATASAANDIETYQAFFTKYPNGKYRTETQRVIKELKTLEVQKNLDFRKTAEAERKRRQTTQHAPEVKPKAKQSNIRYILMAAGALALMVIGYFVIDSFNTPKKSTLERRTDISREAIDDAKPVEAEPEITVAKKQPLNLTSESQILGTWKSNQGIIRLKTAKNRVYGDLGGTAIIEGVLDIPSKLIKGVWIKGARRTSFVWLIEGWTLQGKETWIFTDKQKNANWTGEKISSKAPELLTFPWDGTWKTNKGTARFSQKGNIVTGSLRGDKYNTGSIKATYNPSTKKLKGQVITKPFPASFDVSLRKINAFSGPSQFTKVMLVPVLTPITWTGNKIK